MALYSYQAFSRDGQSVSGKVDAASLAAAKEHLVQQGLFPVSVEIAIEGSGVAWYKRFFSRGISLKEKILFTKQLAVLLRSGVPLLQAVELLTEQFEGRMRTILVRIKDEIKEGESLAMGLSYYPRIFDAIYVQLVRAGEATGHLEKILDRLVDYMERREEVFKRVKSALTYPLIQLIVVGIATGILMIKVVPQFSQMLSGMGRDLPINTRFLLGVSNFLQHHFIGIGIVFVVAIGLFYYWKSTAAGARVLDQAKLKIPVVRYFTRTGAVVQFCSTLGMLLEGGVHLAEALDIVCNIITNRVLTTALEQAREKIVKQGKITQYLKQTDMFPSVAVYLIKTGEESGKLDHMLLVVAKNYEKDLIEAADSLSSKIEPLMLVLMAGIVGFIVLSVVKPMVEVSAAAGGV